MNQINAVLTTNIVVYGSLSVINLYNSKDLVVYENN